MTTMTPPSPTSTDPATLAACGYERIDSALDRAAVARLVDALEQSEMTRLSRGKSIFGGRNLLGVPEVRALAASPEIRAVVEPVVGRFARPVRALFFDKTPEANWPVLWHQDLSLALAERHDIDGWGPWTMKAGVPHVQPPASVLAQMLAVRVHLDGCGADNGPLRVLPGTHSLGRLDRNRIDLLRRSIPEIACLAPVGSALLMRPLLLHASSPAETPGHRRVVHIEFAPAGLLPPPLAWAH